MRSDLHEANRLSWNAATRAHNSHKADQAAFFRNGGSTLYPEELQLLGHLDGLRLLHLQCNAGQDSLSLARLGARVTGVDIADSAIDFARQLSRDSGIAADFQRDDILRWLPVAATRGERFERVFASYGTLVWLSDLKRWADGIAQVLVPGGRFVLVEFHPFALYFDPHWQPAYDYFSREPIAESGVSDYVAESGASLAPSGYRAGVENFSNPHPSYEFQWGLADVIGALLGACLQLERLEEYPYANGWTGFDGMRDGGGGRMLPPADRPRLPLMYGLSARKPR